MELTETQTHKSVRSDFYNYDFSKENGYFRRWGRKIEDDPDLSVFGPEIADIEISTICHGVDNKPCKFCYKSNTGQGENMSFVTFKEIFHKFPKNLTQIAFGIGDIDGNPDLFKIMEYCRDNDYNQVIPNITINGWGLTDEYADKLAKVCGSIAVSRYEPKEVCYDAVWRLDSFGADQINIHMLLSRETYRKCHELLDDVRGLKGLNAIVFLALKAKGRGRSFCGLDSVSDYRKLIGAAFARGINIGFDSCSASIFLEAMKDDLKYLMFVEPCESYLFSMYVNVRGETVPCSFLEGEEGYEPINLLEVGDFMEEVWCGDRIKKFREVLLGNGRKCPRFKI